MTAKSVSVIIPTHNRATLIRPTLDSVWHQTYRPIELLLIDDGSTDNTRQVVEDWAAEKGSDPSFDLRYVQRPVQGANAARNHGYALATGHYIQFFDSDDLMLPDKLSVQVDALEEGDFDFVACDYKLIDANEEKTIIRLSSRGHTAASHILRCALNTPAPLYQSKALADIGPWSEELTRWGDLEFSFRVLANELKGSWLPKVLYIVNDHKESITGSIDKGSYESCLRSCELMESTALELSFAGPRFSNAIGRRLVNISYEAADRGLPEVSDRLFSEASSRLGLFYRGAHWILRHSRKRGTRQ
jgi:glycosyltransferase involved in cell wall biosynthesis